MPEIKKDQTPAGSQQPLVRELYDVLTYIRPLAVAISMDGGEPPWRQAKAERAVAKIDAVLIAVDALPNAPREPRREGGQE